MTPPEEHESAVAAYLNDPDTQREFAITQLRFPGWSLYEVATFTLGVLTYAALNVYEITTVTEVVEKEEDEEEPWKRGYHDPDATGQP